MKINRKKKEFSPKAVGHANPRPSRPQTAPHDQFGSLNILCVHAARTLPDSLVERKRLLAALANIVRLGHPATRQLRAQMALLRGFEAMQSGLAEAFEVRREKGEGRE